MSMELDIQNLVMFPLFKQLDKDELEIIKSELTLKHLHKNTTIFLQGEAIESVFFILEGRVKIFKNDIKGREQIVAILKEGDMFPHNGLFFREGLYPANSITIQDTILFSISLQKLELLLTKYPKISLQLIKHMGERIIDLHSRLEEKLLNTPYEQVVKLLLRLSSTHGVTLSSGKVLLLTKFQNKELGLMIGLSRETVSRIINKLFTKEIISKDKQGRFMIDTEMLEDEI